MRIGMSLGILVAVLAISGAGCAGVEWTEQMFAKRQVEVDERFVKVETGVQQQGARIDRVEVQVAKIDSRLTETQDLVRGTGVTVSQPPSQAQAPPLPGPLFPKGASHGPFQNGCPAPPPAR